MAAHDDEDRIRRRAYAIWEREGRPEGRAEAHWDMAREELAQQQNLSETTQPNPAAIAPPGDPESREGGTEAMTTVVNTGETPGLTD